MLPLLTQKLALAYPGAETTLVAACVLMAQLVSVPTALLVGARADAWGRKPLLLAGFAALPLRGILFTISEGPAWLIAVQALDGIAPASSMPFWRSCWPTSCRGPAATTRAA